MRDFYKAKSKEAIARSNKANYTLQPAFVHADSCDARRMLVT